MNKDDLPVFLVINGELVPKPGNKRDPNRRYVTVVGGAEGDYYREFTDEEERRTDQWEADRPQREAEEAKKAAQFRESLKYQQRIVAFLDVLGWSAAIKQSIKDPMLAQQLGIVLDVAKTRAQIHEQLKQQAGDSVASVFPEDTQITHFSDCILVSVAATEYARMYIESELATIVSNLLKLGFLVRGAIVQGMLIHKESLAYGPALVQAYALESEIARVPRVILDPALAKQWMPRPYVDKDKKLIGYQKIWTQDVDGWTFFDFLRPFIGMPPEVVSAQITRSHLEPLRSLIVSRLTEHKTSPNILAKYYWVARHFNRVVDEYPGSGLAKIDLAQ